MFSDVFAAGKSIIDHSKVMPWDKGNPQKFTKTTESYSL